MPCTFNESPSEAATATIKFYREKLDEVTAIACKALGAFEAQIKSDYPESHYDSIFRDTFTPEELDWWEDHKKRDEARQARERAIAKLTPEEIDILGIRL